MSLLDQDWLEKYKTPSNYIPGQKEIEYFWPLTEQIYLDLDFTRSKEYDNEKHQAQVRSSISNGGTGGNVFISTGASSWATSQLIVTQDGIETPEITFTLNKKPFIIKRLAYKFLGIKWKVK